MHKKKSEKDCFTPSVEGIFKNMRLIIGGEETIDQPDDAVVSKAVRAVTGYRRTTRRERRRTAPWNVDPAPFLILVHDHGPNPESLPHFMQAYWYPAVRRGDISGFLLEYQEGSEEEHWETYAVSIEDTAEAFLDFLHGSTAWKERFDWKRKIL